MENTITHTQLQDEFRDCLKVGLVPYVRSSPGIGKSDAAHKFAQRADLKVIDLRLSQCTPEDLQGFPMRDGDKAVFTPFDLFPLAGEELPAKLDSDGNEVISKKTNKPVRYNGWLLLLDELSSANKAVQAAAYKIVLDRQVGSFALHDDCHIIACGNKITDKAVVHKMSTALQSRLIHYELAVSTKDWVDWAIQAGIDFRITAFVQFNQAMLMNFTADHTDHTYACPRTWEFLSRMIKDRPISRTDDLAKVAGTVGSAAGFEFLTFCEVQKDIPNWSDVLDPVLNLKIGIPSEASARFATVCWAASRIKKGEVEAIIPFMKRFGADLQVIFCRGIIARFNNIDREVPAFGEYALGTIVRDHI